MSYTYGSNSFKRSMCMSKKGNSLVEGSNCSVDVFVDKHCPVGPLKAGDEADFTVKYGNQGAARANSVTITDNLRIPSGVMVKIIDNGGASGPANGTVITGPATATFSLSGFALDAGETDTFTIRIHIEAVTSSLGDNDDIDNMVTIYTCNDTNISNNRDCCSVKVKPGGCVDVFIRNSCPVSPLTVGNNGSFIVNYGNNGTATATDVDISDTLHIPAGVTIKIINNDGTSGPENNTVITGPANATFTLNDLTLAPGQSSIFTIVINIMAASTGEHTITNKATISTPCDGKPCNNQSSCSVVVRAASDLFVCKLCPAGPLTTGDNAEFVVNYGNNGSATAANITITDDLSIPAGIIVTVVDNDETSGPANGTAITGPDTAMFTRNVPSLAPGETGSFTIKLHINNVTVKSASIVNIANITGTSDTNVSNNTDRCSVEVEAPQGCVVEPIPFFCYVIVPGGFKPVINPATKKAVIASAIIKDCTYLCVGAETINDVVLNTSCGPLKCNIELPTTELTGCVEVENALKITDDAEQVTYICCHDCVYIDKATLCVGCPGSEPIALDASIDVDPGSLDAIFVDDSCEDEAVYRIIGKLVVTFDCPTC